MAVLKIIITKYLSKTSKKQPDLAFLSNFQFCFLYFILHAFPGGSYKKGLHNPSCLHPVLFKNLAHHHRSLWLDRNINETG